MYSFINDYSEGAHPSVLEALVKSNSEQTSGYGNDEYCAKARKQLKQNINNEDVDVHFLVGGTQTNLVMIASMLKSHEAVIAVDSGHIFVHETGSIEACGHKVVTRPHQNGKLTCEMIQSILDEHTDEHMVKPKMVYISQTTEYGTVYSKEEVEALSMYCKAHDLYFFIDGARLGSALALSYAPSMEEISHLCDAFYIGGTKMGALFGECLVIVHKDLKPDFRYHMKQRGALLAKGRLLGIQFLTLFTDDLYVNIGKHENEMASILRKGFEDCNITFFMDSPSNQLFPILDKQVVDALQQQFSFMFMHQVDETHACYRFVTSFATPKEEVEAFVTLLKSLVK